MREVDTMSIEERLKRVGEMCFDLIAENEMMEMDLISIYGDGITVERSKDECARRHERQRKTIRDYLGEKQPWNL